jgi:hypothetical protein
MESHPGLCISFSNDFKKNKLVSLKVVSVQYVCGDALLCVRGTDARNNICFRKVIELVYQNSGL